MVRYGSMTCTVASLTFPKKCWPPHSRRSRKMVLSPESYIRQSPQKSSIHWQTAGAASYPTLIPWFHGQSRISMPLFQIGRIQLNTFAGIWIYTGRPRPELQCRAWFRASAWARRRIIRASHLGRKEYQIRHKGADKYFEKLEKATSSRSRLSLERNPISSHQSQNIY